MVLGNRIFPRAEDLNLEEVDFELELRNLLDENASLDLPGKQRLLRIHFKEEAHEPKTYQSLRNIRDEADHIEGRIDSLAKALERKIEAKYESRVLHYWNRARANCATNEEEKTLKKDLIFKIEKLMRDVQIGPLSPTKGRINEILSAQENDTTKLLNPLNPIPLFPHPFPVPPFPDPPHPKPNPPHPKPNPPHPKPNSPTHSNPDSDSGTTTSSVSSNRMGDKKNPKQNPDDFIQVKRSEYEEMNRLLDEMKRKMEKYEKELHADKKGGSSNPGKGVKRNVYSSDDDSRLGENSLGADDECSSVDNRDQRRRPFREIRNSHGYSQNRRDNFHDRESKRIEKWRVRFCGDSREASVENFLYKVKKLAKLEEVSRSILLKNIHILLDGAALEWYFTSIDELDCWDEFEDRIAIRFGNPNKDQGIRSQIQERKQQKGETFTAFVSEIERLNHMLSEPLSKRRMFEVIWDNMRQYYRSKLAIVEVKDLRHLTRLNRSIDAADPSLHPQSSGYQVRRSINNIEAEDSDYEEETSINEVRGRYQRDTRFQNNRNDVYQRSSTSQQQPSNIVVNPPQLQQPTNSTVFSNQQGHFSGVSNQQGHGVSNQQISTNIQPQIIQNPGQQPPQHRVVTCWNCQGVGHGWRRCTQPKLLFCYGCGNLGRTILSCERCARTSDLNGGQQQGN